ncbi:MAG: DNA polymerase III subunit delta' [Nitrospirota bacterium]
MALRDIKGQEKALRIFSGMLRRGRVPSAMLLSGDKGVGKMSAALNFAKAVNCLQPVDFDACDVCSSCRKIDAGTHPDITVMVTEGDEIKIDDMRRLEEVLFLRPYEGRKKVALIDDADTMNSNAANAFLKTLEEPPEDCLIVLVSSNPDRLLDTIRSRCTPVRFYPLPRAELTAMVPAELEGEARQLALALSMGRPGLAKSVDFLGERAWFFGLLEAMLRGDAKEAWTDKAEMRSWLDMAFVFLRDVAVMAAAGDESGLLYGKNSYRAYRNIAPQAAFNAWQRLQKMSNLLDFNLNKSISWNYVASIMQQLMTHGPSHKAVSASRGGR